MKHLGILVVLAACDPVGTTATTTPARPAPLLELGEVTLFEGDDAMLKLHANGATEMGYRHGENIRLEPGKSFSTDTLPIAFRAGPSMASDGTLTMHGKAVAQVRADGTIVDLATGKPAPGVTVTPEAVHIDASQASVTLELAGDGTLAIHGGNRAPDKPLRIAGADTPGKRRAILALVALTLAPRANP